jgi:pyruvate dehydrogenase E1 component alpha subunit
MFETFERIKCLAPLENSLKLSAEKQLAMYYRMNLIRLFDTNVKDLWMAGKIYGLAHSYVGAEAIAVGACEAIGPADAITSTHRGHGHCIAKGADPKKMMAELFGKYEGYNHGKGGSMHIADTENGMMGATGIVGSGMPLALGAAFAADYLGNKSVAICFHGDGGANQGVWHESMNMAAAWKLPVIFLIENNQMAVGTELSWVSKETELYKRAAGYGMPGVQVDGFNVFEVHKAVKEAADRARAGEGPTLIEASFLRLLGHFVADDQWYRDMDEVAPYWELDPIKRMREYLLSGGVAEEPEIAAIEEKTKKDIAGAISYAEFECSEPPAGTLYDDIYADGEIII